MGDTIPNSILRVNVELQNCFKIAPQEVLLLAEELQS